MKPNPFSPSFGIDPENFYGREEYIASFERALLTSGSADRFFMLTGTRGCGKTSLLHQYALKAKALRWDVIEATNIDALDLLVHYVGLDRESTRMLSVAPSVSAVGVGASVGAATSSSKTSRPISLLNSRLGEKLESLRLKKGLAFIVDEAQKASREDVVRIGNAVQHARTAGLPVALVFGGLPNVYNKIRGYKDCTFLRRMKRVELWCMKKSESRGCLAHQLAKVPELRLSRELFEHVWNFAGGHPYLLQLIGDNIYRMAEKAYDPVAGMAVDVDRGLVESAESQALAVYKANVLDDLFTGTHKGTRRYVELAYELRDERGRTETAKINARFGKSAKEMSSTRQYALDTQVIRRGERGEVRFALPHYEYIFETLEEGPSYAEEDDWDYR